MPHEMSAEELSAFLDGELGQEDRGRVETHLASCPECASLLERLRKASSGFKAHGLREVPAGLLDRALAAARGKGEPSLALRRLEFAFALAALLAVVLLGGIAVKRHLPAAFQQVQEMIGKAAGSLGH